MIEDRSQPKPGKEHRFPEPRRRPGTLYVVGTPIGHPDDITVRALKVLKQVPIVAAETPLVTRAFLAHHGVHTTVTRYDPRNHEEKIAVLLHQLRSGYDVALVSDSGMPVIYDPGRLLILAAHKAGLPVTVIPGPSAFTAATALSGFSGDRMLFEGKAPKATRHLLKLVGRFKREPGTAVLFVLPDSLTAVLDNLARHLPTRKLALAVNLTRQTEALYRGTPRALMKKLTAIPADAEITMVIEGRKGKRDLNKARSGRR